MNGQHAPHGAHRTEWTSAPRPFALPFRVQLRDDDSRPWQTYACFEFLGEAEACLHELKRRGIEARLDSQRTRTMTQAG
jgi:hypothetical protein